VGQFGVGGNNLFKWFLDKGADVNATDQDGQDVVLYLLEYGHEEMAEWVRKHV